MRKWLIIAVFLFGLAIGYLAGCRSHGLARTVTVTAEPAPSQHWRDRDGHARIVRTVRGTRVWWYRNGASGADRECSLTTWRAWVRNKGAKVE